jgi:hypothetical protein
MINDVRKLFTQLAALAPALHMQLHSEKYPESLKLKPAIKYVPCVSMWVITWFWRTGHGSWVNPTSAISLFKEIIKGWTVGWAASSPAFDFYSAMDLRCGLIYWTLNYARDYPQWYDHITVISSTHNCYSNSEQYTAVSAHVLTLLQYLICHLADDKCVLQNMLSKDGE